MVEWQVIGDELGKMFAEHTQSAITEEHDIGNVRYHKGWIDAINEMLDMLVRLFPVPGEEERPSFDEEPGDRFISRRTDGSVY